MNILIFGETVHENQTLQKKIEKYKNIKICSGKDYLRLSKNPNEALNTFKALLQNDEKK